MSDEERWQRIGRWYEEILSLKFMKGNLPKPQDALIECRLRVQIDTPNGEWVDYRRDGKYECDSFDVRDCEIRTYRDGRHTVAMQIRHLPTGKYVRGATEGSEMLLRRALLSDLEKSVKQTSDPIV